MLNLRAYQRAAVDAVHDFWASGGENPLVEAATGTGKSVMVATLTRELCERYPDMRVLCLVHVRELVEQNAKALLRVWPAAPIGINSAGLGRRDWRSRVLFASIQSVYRAALQLGQRDLVLIDEAHLVPQKGDGMYRRLLDDLRERTPDARVVGFTATPYRLDSGRLDEGSDRLFSQIVYSYGIAEGIADGHLSPLVSKATTTTLDVSGVARSGGEFVASSLAKAVDRDDVTEAAVSELVRLGADRRSWLLFASSVAHAAHLRDAVRARGIRAEMISGETPAGERNRLVTEFRDGRLRCLTNCGVLTTGFDAPGVDLVAMLRPTLSVGLYVQIVGRGTRRAPGKADCLILDYAGNVRRHGPVDAIVVESKSSRSRAAGAEVDQVRAKACPDCETLVALNTRICVTCGHEWLHDEAPKHEAEADGENAILSDGKPRLTRIDPTWLPVTNWSFRRHQKAGSPDSLCVEFHCGVATYRLWLCLEHDGYARNKAAFWWKTRGGGPGENHTRAAVRAPMAPTTITEALERISELTMPAEIRVRPNGKYTEIVGYRGVAEAARAAA